MGREEAGDSEEKEKEMKMEFEIFQKVRQSGFGGLGKSEFHVMPL